MTENIEITDNLLKKILWKNKKFCPIDDSYFPKISQGKKNHS